MIGFPDWWDDYQSRKAATKAPRTGGKAHVATSANPDLITQEERRTGSEGDEDSNTDEREREGRRMKTSQTYP